jgi:hypothetical protein
MNPMRIWGVWEVAAAHSAGRFWHRSRPGRPESDGVLGVIDVADAEINA